MAKNRCAPCEPHYYSRTRMAVGNWHPEEATLESQSNIDAEIERHQNSVGGDDQDDDDDDWELMEGENGGHIVNECEFRLDGSRKTGAALSCSEQGADFCTCEDARPEFNSAGG